VQTQEQARMAENQAKEREAMGVEETGEMVTPKVSAVADTAGDEPSPGPETGEGEEDAASEPPPTADS
jgi:hypothetical protein